MNATNTTNQVSQNDNQTMQGERALQVLAGFVGVGLVAIVLYALQSTSLSQFLTVVGVSIALAGASLLAGALLGFLFGIPRTLRQTGPSTPVQAGDIRSDSKNDAVAGKPETLQYQPNTNLEEISDWLTKILVGVGLTQISKVPGLIEAFASTTAAGLGGFPNSGTFAIGLLVYDLICGFLIGYLWTRLYLAGAFREADRLAALEKTIQEIVSQQDIDARALHLVDQQLGDDGDRKEVSQDEFNEVIAKASASIRPQIYYRVAAIRSDARADPATRTMSARTIPVLRALIASDAGEKYDSNHGDLGVELMNQQPPDWDAALAELNKAIEIRNRAQSKGAQARKWYEFYRAICRMALDPNLSKREKAGEDLKKQILEDLDAAKGWRKLKEAAESELAREASVMKDWLVLNAIDWPPTG